MVVNVNVKNETKLNDTIAQDSLCDNYSFFKIHTGTLTSDIDGISVELSIN